jgi:hypothetical protein
MARSKSTRRLQAPSPSKAPSGETISVSLVQLRCQRAYTAMGEVRRLLRVAACAIKADEDGIAELPEEGIVEILGSAVKRLEAIEETLDEVAIRIEPSAEEREEVAGMEKVKREIEQGHAERRS